jgi:transposase
MGLLRRQFTKEFKLAAVRRLEQGVSIAEAARALEVSANVLHRWRRELERKVGQQALEIDFLKGCLQRIEEQRMLQALTGNPPSTGRSKKK